MKERMMVKSVVALLALVSLLVAGDTDVMFVVVTIALFGVGVAYAEGCEKL